MQKALTVTSCAGDEYSSFGSFEPRLNDAAATNVIPSGAVGAAGFGSGAGVGGAGCGTGVGGVSTTVWRARHARTANTPPTPTTAKIASMASASATHFTVDEEPGRA